MKLIKLIILTRLANVHVEELYFFHTEHQLLPSAIKEAVTQLEQEGLIFWERNQPTVTLTEKGDYEIKKLIAEKVLIIGTPAEAK